MVFRYKAPISTVCRIVAVIAHHPIVIHFEGVGVRLFTIDINIMTFDLHFVFLVNRDSATIDREGKAVELHCPATFGYDNRAEIVLVPAIIW